MFRRCYGVDAVALQLQTGYPERHTRCRSDPHIPPRLQTIFAFGLPALVQLTNHPRFREITMSSPTLEELEKALVDETAPIAKRTRCVFYLKHMGGKAAIDALTKGITNARSGKFLAPFVEPLCSEHDKQD
jgi:hypothetical protein